MIYLDFEAELDKKIVELFANKRGFFLGQGYVIQWACCRL